MKYSKNRLFEHLTLVSINRRKIPVDSILTLFAILKNENSLTGQADDIAIFRHQDTNDLIKIPIRELLHKHEVMGFYERIRNSDSDVNFPDVLKVYRSCDLIDRDGELIYPLMAYKAAKEMLATGEIDWVKLRQSGLVENCKYEPLQHYQFEIIE